MQTTRKFQEDIHEYKYFKGKNGPFLGTHTFELTRRKITDEKCRIDFSPVIFRMLKQISYSRFHASIHFKNLLQISHLVIFVLMLFLRYVYITKITSELSFLGYYRYLYSVCTHVICKLLVLKVLMFVLFPYQFSNYNYYYQQYIIHIL